jgi:hypothetical protein
MSWLTTIMDWKNGLALLGAIAIIWWLNPLPPPAIALVVLLCVAAVHVVAAGIRLIARR